MQQRELPLTSMFTWKNYQKLVTAVQEIKTSIHQNGGFNGQSRRNSKYNRESTQKQQRELSLASMFTWKDYQKLITAVKEIKTSIYHYQKKNKKRRWIKIFLIQTKPMHESTT